MAQIFDVVVTLKNGKKLTATAKIGGGTMTKEAYIEQLERTDAFPGATNIDVTERETDEDVPTREQLIAQKESPAPAPAPVSAKVAAPSKPSEKGPA